MMQCVLIGLLLACAGAAADDVRPVSFGRPSLRWESLPDLPDALGVAGPLVGVDHGALIVAGGANFPVSEGLDLWTAAKVWHDDVWVLTRSAAAPGQQSDYRWLEGYRLERPVAYGACVTTSRGIACLGGCDGQQVLADCFLLGWDPVRREIKQTRLPSLPRPCAYGAAAAVGEVIYLAGGQSRADLASAMTNFWRLDLAGLDNPAANAAWEELPPWPGPSRAFNLAVAQHNGFDDCVYVISGRRQSEGTETIEGITFLTDTYEFDPRHYDPAAYDARAGHYAGAGRYARPWRKRTDVPRCVMAGTAAALGQSHIFVLSGADGSLMARAEGLRDRHPGFPKRAWAYHTITDTWIDGGTTPANQVTTPVTAWEGKLILASGEIRPRVRTRAVWAIEPVATSRPFGAIDFGVLIVYLAAMLGVGVYFSRRNKDTDDYFRGGKKIVWWAAGCSIFATMLSSITYMAIPAKAFAQDQVYLLGNLMVMAVAPIAVYVALPFFRQIDATSAYEYLEKRFHRAVRLLASTLFTLFHIFRMGIVMSLAALALATVTPLSATQCVLIMGTLSILYSTLGGVEAVVWTDTIQTFVLLGGAVLCIALMVAGADGSIGSLLGDAAAAGKFRLGNLHWDPTGASLALWVVVLGGFGQCLSSYTADQAVVQRYMTTPDTRRAARSIWLAAWLAAGASMLFFLLGTALWMFYRSHPEKLDPTFMTDQMIPLFISHEVPVGAAGLIVAGIFAAAQSTISTSMNSTATAVVTDLLHPLSVLKTERGYLRCAQGLTFGFGLAGMLLGLLFVDPEIKSLFDQFLKVIGLFMGVLGGLFALGMFTRRANAIGAAAGTIGGAAVVLAVEHLTQINGYVHAAVGVLACLVIGYLVSLATGQSKTDLGGLTIFDRAAPADEASSKNGSRLASRSSPGGSGS